MINCTKFSGGRPQWQRLESLPYKDDAKTGLVQPGEELAAGVPHSSPPIDGKGKFSKNIGEEETVVYNTLSSV